MSPKPTRSESSELERLYAAGREIEPAPGMDRIILARAEQAQATTRSHRPARWLGGLATAAALVLAVGVVLQQSAFEGDSLPATLSEPAPATGQASPAPAAESARSKPSLDRLETRSLREAPALRSRPAESEQEIALGRQQPVEAIQSDDWLADFGELSEADGVADSESEGSESFGANALLARAAEMDEQAVLDWITELLERGDLPRASLLLQHLGERQAEADRR